MQMTQKSGASEKLNEQINDGNVENAWNDWECVRANEIEIEWKKSNKMRKQDK